MASSFTAPVRSNERIEILDCIRGIALLGILLMNSMAQGQPGVYYDKLDLSQPLTGANFWAWVVECFLFEGTMRGLFSILFGAGAILLLTRLEKKNSGLQPADIYYRRLFWLLLFGLLNAFIFLWPGDILYSYAICGLLLFPFRNLKAKHYLWIAFAFLAIGTYRENSMLYHDKNLIKEGEVLAAMDAKKVSLNEDQKETLGKYQGFKERSTKEGIVKDAKKDVRKIQGKSYYDIFLYYRDQNMRIESMAFYKFYWWDILLFFFIGMAFFKSGFLTGKKSAKLYAIVAFVGIAAGLALNYFFQKIQYDLRFDQYVFTQRWRFSYYEIRRVFQTVGYLSLLLLLYKVIPFRRILRVFAPVGQMAFTNYLMQSVLTSIIFYGFGLWGKLQRYQIYYVVGSVWLFEIIFSHIWLQYFRFGPFEWLWRSLTYQKKQPMRKHVVSKTPEDEMGGTPMPAIA